MTKSFLIFYTHVIFQSLIKKKLNISGRSQWAHTLHNFPNYRIGTHTTLKSCSHMGTLPQERLTRPKNKRHSCHDMHSNSASWSLSLGSATAGYKNIVQGKKIVYLVEVMETIILGCRPWNTNAPFYTSLLDFMTWVTVG